MKKEKNNDKQNGKGMTEESQKENNIKSEEPLNEAASQEVNENIEEVNKEKIDRLEKEVREYQDKLLRKAAEFENYKRRTENEHINLIKYAAESFIVKLLPTIDDFERSLQHIENAKDITALKEGIKLIYDKLIKVISDQGVKKIDSVGKPFDVHFHEALMQRKAENVAPHTVLDEVEKGYMYKDRVIRHAKVIVSEDNRDEVPNNGEDKTDTKNLSKEE